VKKVAMLSLAVSVLMGICVTVAWAGEATQAAPLHMSLWDLILKSGSIGFCIIGCSIAGLALSIEFGITFRREKLLPTGFVGEMEELFEQEDYEEALNLCESDDNLLANMMGASLAKMDAGYDSMVDTLVEAGEENSLQLNNKLSYLALLANVGPLLGLLGTVVGMVQCFLVFASIPNASAVDLAPGIALALVTTVEGLIVSIPLTTAFHYFRNRIAVLTLESFQSASDLLRRLKPAQA
jgi:biopolymer transport protein ExbB